MELHEFYDKALKHKILKFQGSFSTIQGFLNMKKGVITLDTLIKANKGKIWINIQQNIEYYAFHS